jgi:hypothetical protein
MIMTQADTDLTSIPASEIRNVEGAAAYLTLWHRKTIHPDTVHYMVRNDMVQAYLFQDGLLTVRPKSEEKRDRQGQALYFTLPDLRDARLPKHTKRANSQGNKTSFQKKRQKA